MKQSQDNGLLVLASKSPRRRYLLEQAGLSFSVVPSNIDESRTTLSPAETYARVLAEAKANDVSKKYPDSWVIGADTIVLADGIILGKPGSKAEAYSMLKRLSGQTHKVVTGYTVCCAANQRSFSEAVITEVLFKELAEEEIKWYINTGEPFDKAGAYAIQGLGTFLVKSINGSYTNVVGLPICEVIEFLIQEGVLEI